MKQKINELGRTMVEMLGVLAVVGIITVISAMGYTHGMRYLRAIQIIDDFNELALKTSQDIVHREFPASGEYETTTRHGWHAIIGLENADSFYIYLDTTSEFMGRFPKQVLEIVGEKALTSWKEPREFCLGLDLYGENYAEMQVLDNTRWTRWLRTREQAWMKAIFKNDLTPRIGTLENIPWQDRQNPATCKGFNNNSCQKCIERGNYPVKYEYKPVLSACEMTNGEKGQCDVEHRCVDMCAGVTCESGTTCVNGFCVCPNGQEKCGEVCCEAGKMCTKGVKAQCVSVQGCASNADCSEGEYCQITGASWNESLGVYTKFKAQCKTLPQPTIYEIDMDMDGSKETTLYGTSGSTTWWSGTNYCQALGKRMLSVDDIKCPNFNSARTINQCGTGNTTFVREKIETWSENLQGLFWSSLVEQVRRDAFLASGKDTARTIWLEEDGGSSKEAWYIHLGWGKIAREPSWAYKTYKHTYFLCK